MSRHVTPIQIEPTGRRPLRGEIQAWAVGGLGVARVAGLGVRARHTCTHIARASHHVYAACVHVAGEARIIRDGETTALRRGDIFITDSRHEFTLDLDRPWRHLLITLPTSWLDRRVARPDLVAGAVLRDHPLARLWASDLAAGFALADELSSAAAALFATQSVELLAQLLNESHSGRCTPSETSRAATFVRACRTIALRFSDPDLTPHALARELGVSTRTLERVFAANNATIMRRVFDERIRQAARLLAAAPWADKSITDIAFACGFNDVSHFGRMFAATMHMTPSRWRAER